MTRKFGRDAQFGTRESLVCFGTKPRYPCSLYDVVVGGYRVEMREVYAPLCACYTFERNQITKINKEKRLCQETTAMITKLPRASASERSEIAKSSYLIVCELQFPSAKKTGESVRAPMTPHAMNFPPDDETYLPLELENHRRSLRAAHLTSPFR